jgi:hypothetical protein
VGPRCPARQPPRRLRVRLKTPRRRLRRRSGPHPRSQRNCHRRHSHGGRT